MSNSRGVRWALSIILCAALLGCTASGGDGPASSGPPSSDGGAAPTEGGAAGEDGPDSRDCAGAGLGDGSRAELTGDDPVALAARIAEVTHACARTVVLAPADDPAAAAVAAPLARAHDAPLLLVDDAVEGAAVAGLEPREIVAVGVDAPDLDDEVTVTELDDDAAADDELPAETVLALAALGELASPHAVLVPRDDDGDIAAASATASADTAVIPAPTSPDGIDALAAELNDLDEDLELEVLGVRRFTDRVADADIDAEKPDTSRWGETDEVGGTGWLIDPAEGALVAAAGVAAGARDEVVLPVDRNDLRAGRARTQRVHDAELESAVLLGAVTDEADWQLDVILDGPELPGGGFKPFEDERIVGIYGKPGASSLGVLGEQGVDASMDRAAAVAEPYATGGHTVVPAHDLIATTASSAPGPDGDYSNPIPAEELEPWVEATRESDQYLILDLQPGRSDFLSQAREYEHLLREPHVGIALDPEWRLAPGERHLEQIGSVGVAEVQAVADWLAELTREENLPQKLLVLHQFRISMLPDRDQLDAPEELAVVVHMDGQGAQPVKDATYQRITEGAEDRWHWGWKNFYDEDPTLASPSQVLDREPEPVFVTYQ